MTREAFYAWREQQPRGRFERIDGEVFAMAPKRLGHIRMKVAVAIALSDAIAKAGLPCEAFGDDATVPAGEDDFEPDALVTCGERLPSESTIVASPVVVVEWISPGTNSIDTGAKLAAYFAVPSGVHDLIVHPAERLVVHHRRETGPKIETQVVRAGSVVLESPGIVLDVDALYGGVL